MTEKQENKNTKLLFGKIPVISAVGAVFGIIGGYVYYLKVGCNSGSCAITSNPWLSMLWGAAMGYLIFDIFAGIKKK
jgi:xanthine/uracil permease